MMLLKFATNEINEFDSSARHFVNDGAPFEVADGMGEAMLLETARINPRTEKGKMVFDTVNVFERYEKKPSHSLLPEDFPHVADLEKNNVKTFGELFALTELSEPDLKGIGEKRLAEILAARGLYTEDGVLKVTESDEQEKN